MTLIFKVIKKSVGLMKIHYFIYISSKVTVLSDIVNRSKCCIIYYIFVIVRNWYLIIGGGNICLLIVFRFG